MTATATPSAPDLNRRYTADELLAMPPGARFELVRGKMVPMSPTSDDHGRKTNRLGTALSVHVYNNDLGECWAAETGFLLARDPDTVLAPDFAFVARERLGFQRTKRGYVPVAPDLVVETRSPSDRLTAMTDKIGQWLSFGVRIALLLDPLERTLSVYQPGVDPLALGPSDTLDGGDVLPGFSLPLFRLFAD